MAEWQYIVKVVWKRDQESLDECAFRTKSFLHKIEQSDRRLGQWTLAAPQGEPLLTTHEALKAALLSGVARDDTPLRKIVTSAGYSAHFQIGEASKMLARLQIVCGVSGAASKLVSICEMRLSRSWAETLEPAQVVRLLEQFLAIAAQVWEPEWGYVSTSELEGAIRDEYGNRPNHIPQAMWMTYLDRERREPPAMHGIAEVVDVPEAGRIVVATRDVFRLSEHETTRKAIQNLLSTTDALYPVNTR